MSNTKGKHIFCYQFSLETFGYTLVYDSLSLTNFMLLTAVISYLCTKNACP